MTLTEVKSMIRTMHAAMINKEYDDNKEGGLAGEAPRRWHNNKNFSPPPLESTSNALAYCDDEDSV